MPKAQEICEIVAGGRSYRAWTSVSVTTDHKEVAAIGTFSVAEDPRAKGFADLQLLPGDQVKIFLAGKPAMVGFVIDRQAAYDARSHRVQITAYSRAGDLVHSDLPLKESQFRNSTFEQIARKILKPFGFELRVENGGKDAAKPFKDVNIHPGETAHGFLDRLASMRGLFLTSDETGAVVAHRLGDAGPVADLVEGRNILSAACQISDLSAFKSGQVIGQQRGDDNTDGDKARKPAAAVEWGEFPRHKHKMLFPEMPDDSEGLKIRADHMSRVEMAAKIEVQITVQGWLRPGGDLWKIRERVKVISPMLMLKHELGIARVVFTQDNDSGTRTTLTLIKPSAMGAVAPVQVPPGSEQVMPGGSPSEAKPEEELT